MEADVLKRYKLSPVTISRKHLFRCKWIHRKLWMEWSSPIWYWRLRTCALQSRLKLGSWVHLQSLEGLRCSIILMQVTFRTCYSRNRCINRRWLGQTRQENRALLTRIRTCEFPIASLTLSVQAFQTRSLVEVTYPSRTEMNKRIALSYFFFQVDGKLLAPGPVSQKSRNFSGLFRAPQFFFYLRNAEILSHQTSLSSWFFIQWKHVKRWAFENKWLAIWQLAFRAQNVHGTFEKQTPCQ